MVIGDQKDKFVSRILVQCLVIMLNCGNKVESEYMDQISGHPTISLRTKPPYKSLILEEYSVDTSQL